MSIAPRGALDPPRRRRRAPGRLTGFGRLVLGLSVVLTLLGALAVRSVAAADAPQGNGVAVVAQGLAAMPSDQLVWRVIRDTAPNGAAAPVLERALGFAITEQGPIVIEDAAAGAVAHVGAGEAVFIPEGAQQRHIGFGEGPSSYVRIGLVDAAEADYTAGGDLLAVSPVFAAPAGLRDIELSYAELDGGDDVEIAIATGPVAVVVLEGSVDAAGTEVVAGDAASLDADGSLELIGLEDGTTVYVAAIGPEIVLGSGIPAPTANPNPNPNDTAGSGVVDLFEVGCKAVQPGLSFQDLRAACTAQLPARQVFLGTSAGESIATTAPMGGGLPDMRATFDPVRAGSITLHVGGHESDGWILLATYCGNSAGSGVVPIQNPGYLLADGEYYACFSFFRPA